MGQFKRLLDQIAELMQKGMSEREIALALRCPLDFVQYVVWLEGQ